MMKLIRRLSGGAGHRQRAGRFVFSTFVWIESRLIIFCSHLDNTEEFNEPGFPVATVETIKIAIVS